MMTSLKKDHCVQFLYSLLFMSGSLMLISCAGREHTGQVTEASRFTVNPEHAELKVDDTFEKVWSTVVDVMEKRQYKDLVREKDSHSERYTTQVSREDRPRNKVLQENVTEWTGTIVATTEDNQHIPLQLKDDYHWTTTKLDTLNSLQGKEGRTLQHFGVEIGVSNRDEYDLDGEEIISVMEEIRNRFGG